MIAQGLIRTTSGGRRAYHDILINTEACRDYIERGELDSVEQIMERSGDGMQTTNQPCCNWFKPDRSKATPP